MYHLFILFVQNLLKTACIALLVITHAVVQGQPASRAASIPELAKEIMADVRGDSARLEAIYSWVAAHITYDEQGTGGRRINRTAEDVLARGKAVCYGYAQLMNALCHSAGLDAYIVSGYAMRDNRRMSDAPDHAWNAVRFGEHWVLLDATWGAVPNDDIYRTAFPDIDAFNKDHYPAFPGWQLRDCPALLIDDVESCGYADSLANFLLSGPLEQRVIEARSARMQHPTKSNREIFANALIDLAISQKEYEDVSDSDTSQFHYSTAIRLFAQAEALSPEWFDWQREAYAFALMHHTRNAYNAIPAGGENVDILTPLLTSMVKAEQLLSKVVAGIQTNQAHAQCEAVIAMLQEEISAGK